MSRRQDDRPWPGRDDRDAEKADELRRHGPPLGPDGDLEHPGVEDRIEAWRYPGPQT